MLERGLTTKLFEGFRFYREYGCDFPEYHFPAIEELCKNIKEAGGYSVLAHPMSYFKELNEEELIVVLEDLRSKGLTGIECYYPTHSEKMTQTCVDFCKKYNMLITTGSDEHGELLMMLFFDNTRINRKKEIVSYVIYFFVNVFISTYFPMPILLVTSSIIGFTLISLN